MPGRESTAADSRSTPGCRGRRDVEPIERVDERGDARRARGGRHHLQQQRGAAGRARAGEFRQLAARQPAAQARIERRPCRSAPARSGPPLQRRQRRRQRAIELAVPKGGFEQRAQRMIRHMFASRGENIAKTAEQDQAAKIAEDFVSTLPRLEPTLLRPFDPRLSIEPPPPTGLRRIAAALHLSRLPRAVVRRVHLDHRHLDAEGRAELAGADHHRLVLGVLPRSRLVPRRAADPALHAGRRRGRRSPRSPAAAARVAVHPDDHRLHAGGAGLFRSSSASGTC